MNTRLNTRFNRRFNPLNIFIATALTTVGLAGCGGGDSDDPPSTAAEPAATSDEQSLPEPVTAAGAEHAELAELQKRKITTKAPDWSVYAFGSLWVKQDDGGVVRIDPETGGVLAEIPSGYPDPRPHGRDCNGIGAGEQAIWSCPREGVVSRIDPKTNSVAASLPIEKLPDQGRIVSAAGDVWVLTAEGKRLTAIDEGSNKPSKTIPLGGNCQDLAAEGTTIWVACPIDGRLLRVDAEAGEVSDELALPGAAVVSASEHIWAGFEGGIAEIDPQTLEVLATFEVYPRYGGAIFATPDDVWVREEGKRFLTRIDPRSGRITQTGQRSEAAERGRCGPDRRFSLGDRLPRLHGVRTQRIAALSPRSGRRSVAQGPVDDAGAAAAVGDRGDDQRLADAGVAAGEDAVGRGRERSAR